MGQEIISDASLSFTGGQDASKTPHLVPDNAFFAGVNVTTEDGNIKPRWGLSKLSSVTFQSGGIKQGNLQTKSYRDVFKTGKFQALAYYSVGVDYFIVVVVSGQIFFVNEKTLAVQHIPLEGEQLNPRAPRLNWSVAGKYLVIFDFPAFPVIIEGITARRADPDKLEIPVSNIGGYNQNRLIIGNAGNEFTAGDPVGSTATPNAPITFEEFLTIASPFFGQAFQLNTNYSNDPITAIGFLQVSDQSTEIGPLLVATQSAIYSYLTQTPRSSWEAGQFGSVLVYNAGIAGPRAIDNLNSDVIFFSPDLSIRSLSMSRDEQRKWSKTPISREVKNWLIAHDRELLQYAFVTYFNNKVFISVNPYRTSSLGIDNETLPDYAHGGVVVLELDSISNLTKESPPVWAGLWTGFRPMDMVVCNNRGFAISKDGGVNELYEIRPDLTYDIEGDKVRYIKSKVYTKEYDFGETQFNNKQLHSLDLTLRNVRGDFSVSASFKPDHSPYFIPWREWRHAAPWRNCRQPFSFMGYEAHNFLTVNLGSPKDVKKVCSQPTKTHAITFRNVQLQLEFEGAYWELETLRVKAEIDRQSENITSCKEYPPTPLPTPCNTDWSFGEFETCQQRQT